MKIRELTLQENGRKTEKHVLFIFLLNYESVSEMSDSEEPDRSFEKSKCGHVQIFGFNLTFS